MEYSNGDILIFLETQVPYPQEIDYITKDTMKELPTVIQTIVTEIHIIFGPSKYTI